MTRVALIGLLVVAGTDLANGAAARAPHVLMLLSSDLAPAGEILMRAVPAEISARSPAVVVTNYFVDTVNRAGELHDGLLADALVERYRDDPVDVVIALGPTLDFASRHAARVWPGAKIVLAGFAGQGPASGFGVAAEVVTPLQEFRQTVETFLNLLPGTTRVLLLAGATPVDRQSLAVAERALTPLAGKITIEAAPPVRWADIPRLVGYLPADTVIVPVAFAQDVDGFKARNLEFAAHVATAANRPVLGTLSTYLGHGVVGGRVIEFEAVATELALNALRLLEPETAPGPTIEMSQWQFDARQLARWGIPERLLPPGSRVLFREPTAWQRYRTAILTILAGLTIQSLIIAGLVVERRARKKAMAALRDEEVRRQRAEAHARVQLHEQSHVRTMAAMGQMAATIAHEMNQPLAAALANAQALRRMIVRAGVGDPEIDATVADVIGESKRAGEVVKRIRSLARKGSAEFGSVDLGRLAADAARLVELEAREAGVRITVDRPTDGPMAHGDRVQLLQVMLNLLQNAVHAASGREDPSVHLSVAVDDDTGRARITVTDSGPGVAGDLLPRLFEPFVTTKADGLGLGLAICRAIVDLHDGEIHARNRSPHGAEMTVTLPPPAPPTAG